MLLRREAEAFPSQIQNLSPPSAWPLSAALKVPSERGNLPLGLGDYSVSSNFMPGVPQVKLNISREKEFLCCCQERYLPIDLPRDTQCLSRQHWAHNQGCMNWPLTSLQSRWRFELRQSIKKKRTRDIRPVTAPSFRVDGSGKTRGPQMLSTQVVLHEVQRLPVEESVDTSAVHFHPFQSNPFI